MKMNDIKLLMRMKGYSYSDIANELHVHRQTIYNWMQSYTPERHQKIMNAIDKLSKGDEADE